MATKKNILFVGSECVPFAKTGGLADVMGSLPLNIDSSKYDVRVILPKFTFIADEYSEKMAYMSNFYIDHCGRNCYVGVFSLEMNGVIYYFIDNLDYFSGSWPYTDMLYDLEKYTFFCKAVLAALPVCDFRPDIIHCHDWQTGLIPVYIKGRQSIDPFYADTKTIMTIHNLKYQGVWDVPTIKHLSGLSDDYFTSDKLEAYEDGNLLKGGIAYADFITTVSPNYALEIMEPYYGEGLNGLLKARQATVLGILNGIDTDAYNPAKDKFLTAHYSLKTFAKKRENKASLQRDLGLDEDHDAFVIGMVSRLVEQKGFDLVAQAGEALVSGRTQLVVLGSGESRYEEMLSWLAGCLPDKVSVTLAYSTELEHKIYASVDAFLMPSQFEPCGLSQMMSMRYGTLPIVRETGGLKDSVEPYNEYKGRGTGFSFTRYAADDMINIVNYAKKVFHQDREAWDKMCRRAMRRDFSWKASALKYQELYDTLLS